MLPKSHLVLLRELVVLECARVLWPLFYWLLRRHLGEQPQEAGHKVGPQSHGTPRPHLKAGSKVTQQTVMMSLILLTMKPAASFPRGIGGPHWGEHTQVIPKYGSREPQASPMNEEAPVTPF